MLIIRLSRIGKKNQPIFKIVVIEKGKPPKGGRPLEFLGSFNPLTKKKGLKAERVKYWLSVGAKPSATVYNLLVSEKIIEGKKIVVHKKKKGAIEEGKGVAAGAPVNKEASAPAPEAAKNSEAKKGAEEAKK